MGFIGPEEKCHGDGIIQPGRYFLSGDGPGLQNQPNRNENWGWWVRFPCTSANSNRCLESFLKLNLVYSLVVVIGVVDSVEKHSK